MSLAREASPASRAREVVLQQSTATGGYDVSPDLGWLYDQVPAYAARADIGFYLAEAARWAPRGSAVLEIGCGTGRILVPLARAGHAVAGLDASAAMLARCRAKLAREPGDVRARATVHQGDARDFTLPAPGYPAGVAGPFGLVIAPFRLMQHLISTAEQRSCLASVRRHLAPGGRFAFDVFNPAFPLLTADRSAEAVDTPEMTLGDGRTFWRMVRVPRVRWVDQVLEVVMIYYTRSGGVVERVVHAFEMRWFGLAELEHLLARSGFELETAYGDMGRGALQDSSPEIVIVARRS